MFLDFLFIRFPFCFSLLELSVHTLKRLFFAERHKIFSFKRFQVKLAYLITGNSSIVAATSRALTSNFLRFHIRLLGEECRVKVLNENERIFGAVASSCDNTGIRLLFNFD